MCCCQGFLIARSKKSNFHISKVNLQTFFLPLFFLHFRSCVFLIFHFFCFVLFVRKNMCFFLLFSPVLWVVLGWRPGVIGPGVLRAGCGFLTKSFFWAFSRGLLVDPGWPTQHAAFCFLGSHCETLVPGQNNVTQARQHASFWVVRSEASGSHRGSTR